MPDSARVDSSIEISNGILRALIYLPDPRSGYYRGTRFSWAGIVGSVQYAGREFYRRWYQRQSRDIHDFAYAGNEIIVGPCTAAHGLVEEFSTSDQGLGYDQAPPGGTFIKIGVGLLRRPDAGAYDRFRLYQIVGWGEWRVKHNDISAEIEHRLLDTISGYGYRYRKRVRVLPGSPTLVMDHRLENSGSRSFANTVYDHNFTYIDGHPPGRDVIVRFPFAVTSETAPDARLAELAGRRIVFNKPFAIPDVLDFQIAGFGRTARDNEVTIEYGSAAAGIRQTGSRPLHRLDVWAIRGPLCVEPFTAMAIAPGHAFSWRSRYDFYER